MGPARADSAATRVGRVRARRARVKCAVINAGDGQHGAPVAKVLDAFTLKRR